MRKKLLFFIIILWYLALILEIRLYGEVLCLRLGEESATSDWFRSQSMNQEMIVKLRQTEASERGELAGLFLLRTKTGNFPEAVYKRWTTSSSWPDYLQMCRAIWNDVRFFPVPANRNDPEVTVSYVDSWMTERTYGGNRGHEGTDLMAADDTPGLYPILSMTDGKVVNKGWLEKGGWRLGILAPSGGYFYYAHLDSYAHLDEGDCVNAGEVIGFMGDSGYGPEGTTGMFPVHLHLGIYIYPDGRETSVNPYWILKMIEEKKLSCSY